MNYSLQKIVGSLVLAYLAVAVAAAPAHAQPAMRMGTITCGFNGVPRVTKANASQIDYRQTVTCDGLVDSIEVFLEVWVIPDGRQTWELFDNASDTQTPNVLPVTPFFSENVFELLSLKPCKNGIYAGRAFATVRKGDLSASGRQESIPTLIGNCPIVTGPGPVVDPNNPPMIPPGNDPNPGQVPSVDEVASSVVGKLLDAARAIIRSNGYLVGNINRQTTPNFPVDTVLGATPRPDRTTIDLQVSSGTMSFSGEVLKGCALVTSVNSLPFCTTLFGTPCSAAGSTVRCRGFDDACDRPRTGVFDLVCK
jgi:hypothetical protein